MNIFYNRLVKRFCRKMGISKAIPFKQIPKEYARILMHGTSPADQKKYGMSFEGVIPNLVRRWENTTSEYVKTRLTGYLSQQPCQSCHGARLRPEAIAVKIGGKSINELTALNIEKAQRFFSRLRLDKERTIIAAAALKEIKARLKDLGYI